MLVCIPSPCFVKNKVPQLFAHSVSVLCVLGIQPETGMVEVDSNLGLGDDLVTSTFDLWLQIGGTVVTYRYSSRIHLRSKKKRSVL